MGVDFGAALIYGFRFEDHDVDYNPKIFGDVVDLFETDLLSGQGDKYLIINDRSYHADLDFGDATIVHLPTDPNIYDDWNNQLAVFCEDHNFTYQQPHWLLVATIS